MSSTTGRRLHDRHVLRSFIQRPDEVRKPPESRQCTDDVSPVRYAYDTADRSGVVKRHRQDLAFR